MKTHTVVVKKMLPASCEEVFDAWLDSEGMARWMCPSPATHAEVTLDPHVGGGFRIVMKSPTADYDHRGVFRVLDRPTKLQFSWISAGTDQQESIVTIELTQSGSSCELLLTHEGILREEAAGQHERGWSDIAGKFSEHLARRRRT